MSITIHQALQWGKLHLHPSSDSPSLDALVLLSYVLEKKPTYLIAYSEYLLSAKQYMTFQNYVKRRAGQEPIAYITQNCEFWSLNFVVNANCLIPRPETELLVEKILASQKTGVHQAILDLGTGSGIIAIVLALEKPNWSIIATDVSCAALKIAQTNALRLGATAIDYKHGNWFQAVSSNMTFDHIISNPPYLAKHDPHLKSNLRYEPASSLVSGPTGLEALSQLIQQARFYLKANGCLWLEQGYHQSSQVKAMMLENGYTDIKQYKDLSGIIRVTKGSYTVSDDIS